MFRWMSSKGEDAWQFFFWFLLFCFIPTIPAYYIMSLKGFLGLSALVYAALSWYLIYVIYNKVEKYKNKKGTIVSHG